MDCFDCVAIQAQEDASYNAWMARAEFDNLQHSVYTIIFFQEEAAYHAERARNVLGLNDY